MALPFTLLLWPLIICALVQFFIFALHLNATIEIRERRVLALHAKQQGGRRIMTHQDYIFYAFL